MEQESTTKIIRSKNNPLPIFRRLGITKKILVFFCLTTSIIVFTGIVAGYFSSSKLLHEDIGEHYEKIADNLALTTSALLEIITEHVKVYLANPIHAQTILEAEKRYASKNEGEIKDYLLKMDKVWLPAQADSALVTEYTHSQSADRLYTIVSANKYLSELFTTDRFGGLVAASGKTSDFYQADEEWWQKAYNNGKGDVYISDAEYDDSSQTISLAIAMPIKDSNGRLIGICKAVIRTDALFDSIGNFKMGKTGQALLVNNAGVIIFHRGTKPLSEALCDSKEFTKIVSGPKNYLIPFHSNLQKETQFAAFAVVKNPLLLKRGITWRIFILEDLQEVFSSLIKLFFQSGMIIAIMIILLIPVVFLFSKLFVRPIIRLRAAVEHLKNGDFNYPVNIKTGDEIEWLADSFQEMSGKLFATLQGLEREIAAHKEAEETLRLLEENYQSIFESANDGIVIRNADASKIVNVNKKACDMFCYSKEEMLGLGLEYLDTQDAQYPIEKLKSFFREAAENKPMFAEWLVKDKFGRKFWVEANLNRIKIRNQYYFITILRDITERKQLLEQKENFMSTVSHELRTPLAAIKESVALALEDTTGTIFTKQRELLVIAKNNVDRLTRLINQVLDIQKIGLGRMELNIKENDINKTIEEVYRSMASLAAKKKINFTLQLADNLPKVKFDGEKIIEVLINLVNNALKFTVAGAITITSSLKDNFIQVSVKDTGIGINTQDLPKLFQRFIQLKKIAGGSGLGLYICKELIDLHKGKIWAESIYGKETTFHFTLPLN